MWLQPHFLSVLATAQAHGGAIDEARLTIDQALEEAQCSGDLWNTPDLLRVKGELLRKSNELDAAEASFAAAVSIAHATSARALELRAATSLSSLWASQGRRLEAQRLLVPIYQAFGEGLGTPDLTDARTLLATLS